MDRLQRLIMNSTERKAGVSSSPPSVSQMLDGERAYSKVPGKNLREYMRVGSKLYYSDFLQDTDRSDVNPNGTTNLLNLDVDGTANLDNTDIDGTLVVDSSNISLDSTATLNIDNSNTSNGITIGTATSGVPVSIGHTTSETTVNDNLVVTGDADLNGALDVSGTCNLDVVDIDSTVQIDGTTTFGSNGSGQDVKVFGNTSGSYWEFDASQNSFSSVGASATASPKFGVGVVNPDYAVDVRTDTNGNGYAAFFWNGGNGGDRYGITVRGGAANPASTNTIYYNATDSDDDQVGYIWNTNNTFQLVDPSDERLKDNIRDTSVKGLDSIKAMKVRDFEWKKGGGTMVGGFVAQEMDDAFSPAVAKPDWEEGKTKDEIMWGVSRERLVPVLVKAIQELSSEVDKLKE